MGLFGRSKSTPDPDDYSAVLVWMKDRFDRGAYKELWGYRLDLGYGFAQEDASVETWFWVNAYPALAALRSDVKWTSPVTGQPEWHPLIATAAGYADEAHWDLGSAADDANSEIARRFFG